VGQNEESIVRPRWKWASFSPFLGHVAFRYISKNVLDLFFDVWPKVSETLCVASIKVMDLANGSCLSHKQGWPLSAGGTYPQQKIPKNLLSKSCRVVNGLAITTLVSFQ